MAEQAGVLDSLQKKAAVAAAAHPENPERLLVAWIDILRHDLARLEDLRKQIDTLIDSLHSTGDERRTLPRAEAAVQASGPVGIITVPTPWTTTTIPILHALAESLAEWPEGRPLALHVYERTPSANPFDGQVPLRRAEIALQIPDNETATRALRDWLSWHASAPSLSNIQEVEGELSAAELMARADMIPEAKTLFEKLRNTSHPNPTFKKRKEALSKLLAPPPEEKQ
jgi:hypothetical protein